jgi:hypothetical protein
VVVWFGGSGCGDVCSFGTYGSGGNSGGSSSERGDS